MQEADCPLREWTMVMVAPPIFPGLDFPHAVWTMLGANRGARPDEQAG
jgi:hypothetical protein